MATLTASKVASTVQYRENVAETIVYSTYTLTAAVALNDVIQMVKIPDGATIIDATMSADDLDTDGTPLISISLGDDGDTDRFIASSTIARTGGLARLDNRAGFLYTYTANNTIDVLVVAAPATGATSGDIKVSVTYTMAQ